MHLKTFCLVIAIASLAGVFEAVAQGQEYYGGVVYYYPSSHVVYYGSPSYYSQPVDYSRSVYYSYYSPACVYYVRTVYCEASYGDQPSHSSGYSSRQPAPAKPTTSVNVGMYDNQFSPQTINVQPGATVRWVNYGKHTHTATANDESWDSGDIKPGASSSATFKNPGTFYYYCRHHTQDRMQGIVVVGSGAGNTAESTQSPGY